MLQLGARNATRAARATAMGLRVAGLAGLLSIGASCAMVDGLSDYEECTGACAETRGGDEAPPSTGDAMAGTDATSPPDEGAAAPGDEPSSEAGLDDVAAPPADTTPAPPEDAMAETGLADAPAEAAPPPTGPTCGSRGATAQCNAGQVCCGNLAAQTNACASSCAAGATLGCLTASDCPGSAPICCAQVVLTVDSAGDLPRKCLATQFSASCASACVDTAPMSCTYLGHVRLCDHDADCASDATNPPAGSQCWNFNGAPESWCASAAIGAAGGGVHLP